MDGCREHCFSCGILGLLKPDRRNVPDDAWGCPTLGHGEARQPVDAHPVPLYVNSDMAPELAAEYGPPRPQHAKADRSQQGGCTNCGARSLESRQGQHHEISATYLRGGA